MAAESLLVGQIHDSATPSVGAAELYWLSEGYGAAIGLDTPLLIETPDWALLGEGGQALWRRVFVPFERTGSCTIQVTPFADFEVPLTAKSAAYSSPTKLTRDVLVVAVAKRCAFARVRIEVTARTGLVRVFRPTLLFEPITAAAARVVSPAST